MLVVQVVVQELLLDLVGRAEGVQQHWDVLAEAEAEAH